MSPDKILTPVTPTSWIMSRLREDAELGQLLGDGDVFPNLGADWGSYGQNAPIYKAGEVPAGHPARFVVVRPPLDPKTDYYANRVARHMDSTYLVYGETQTDVLPAGCDLDAVLDPIFQRIVCCMKDWESTTAIGGHVLQVEVLKMYAPTARALNEVVKVGQMGVQINLISTV